ncbi:ECF-type riboflavin transporter substrate-binding protein [Streptococcus sp. sy018]|uniref:ECF-type riboflavin transporter substrate-binding protein n=1 Tax=Streptococcus sp. sy018 TaxID=2600147 RepID=UPI0011B82801|nr:ECF-type riboflavin transporter substrate-binding protein [Streptococcus sp. sy018]TWS94891.1 ECF-type riboflavin transporter substrate-binding protein [Streptococcus sp. sy018]
MKNNSIKKVVATGIGAALFVIIGILVNIPVPVPNTSIQLQYAVLALFALIYGPSVGFFAGFIGHALKDAIQYGSVWWTWVLVSGLIGLGIGLLSGVIKLDKGQLQGKDYLVFNLTQLVVNFIGWGLIAPYADVLIYKEIASKVYVQGIWSAGVNALTVGLGGSLLIGLYARTRIKAGSLSKD